MLEPFCVKMGRSRFGKGYFKEEAGCVDTIFPFIPVQRALGISFESDLVIARLCFTKDAMDFPL